MKNKQRNLTVIRYIFIILLAMLFIIPFIWMIVSSVKSPLKVFTKPIQWIPDEFHWENYKRLFQEYHFERYIWNTVKLCLLNVIGTVVSCSTVAYAFAFSRYRKKNKVFFLVLATMMLPGTVTFFPQFILFAKIGWYGTMLPLWVPSFFGSAYYIFFLRQYFLTVPTAMIDAARIDGCGELKILLRIVAPMAKPVYIVMILNTFVRVWSDFFNQLIYITRSENHTVSMGLSYLNSSYGSTNNSTLPILMAGSFIVSIPVLLIYYFGQKTMLKTYVFKDAEK